MIFCKIDEKLIQIIRKQAGRRMVVDCGCGEGLLGSLMGDIISIDIIDRGEEELIPNILHMDVCDFPFQPDIYFPVFIRPCHGIHFTRRFFAQHYHNIKYALYVSMPRNLEIDIDLDLYDAIPLWNWVGDDGEYAYLITKKNGGI